MTTTTARRTTPDPGTLRSNPARIYVTEARHEFLKLIRIPIFAVSTIALPVLFYVLFGLAFGGGDDDGGGGGGRTTYMMATYGTFGVIGAALFGFGVSVALERGQGWMRLKRVSPMPPLAPVMATTLPWSPSVSAMMRSSRGVLSELSPQSRQGLAWYPECVYPGIRGATRHVRAARPPHPTGQLSAQPQGAPHS